MASALDFLGQAPDNNKASDFLNAEEDTRARENLNTTLQMLVPAIPYFTAPEIGKRVAEGKGPIEAMTMDTGVAISPEASARLTGIGAGMTSVERGLAQITDATPEAELKFQHDAIQKLKQDAVVGDAASQGEIIGILAEPTGFLLPSFKAGSLIRAGLYSAALGAGYGATQYVDPSSNERFLGMNPRVGNALFGAAFATPIGMAFHGLGTGLSRLFDARADRLAKSVTEDIQNITLHFQKKGDTGAVALNKARQMYGMSVPTFAKTLARAGRKTYEIAAGGQDEAAKRLSELETRWSSTLSEQSSVGKGVNLVIEPLSSAVEKIYPKFTGWLRKTDMRTHVEIAKALQPIEHFTDNFYKKLSKTERTELSKLLFNQNFKKARTFIAVRDRNMVKAFGDVENVLKDIGNRYKATGYKIPLLDNYWPRIVKDMDIIAKKEDRVFVKALQRKAQAIGHGDVEKLNMKQVNDAIFSVFDPRRNKEFFKTSGNLKGRKLWEVTDELLPAYADPMDAINHYIHESIKDINNRKFIRGLGYTGNINPDGSDLDKAISSIVKDNLDGLSSTDQSYLQRALRARFGKGEEHTARGWQDSKNIMQTILLGNPLAATTQFGDLVFPAYKFGMFNAARSLFGRKLVKKEQLGLLDAVEELAGDRRFTKKVLDKSLKWGGFNAVDRLGKETQINAALRAAVTDVNKNAAKKLRQRWGPIWGDHMDELITDLRKVDLKNPNSITDNVRLHLWNELADVQPISLSEMPIKYLEHPNGRLAYTLRSFTIKQLDFMRRNIIRDYNQGNAFRAAKNFIKFGTMFVMANSSTDVAKDFMKGKDINVEDTVVDNIWTLVGFNKFIADKAGREKSTAPFIQGFMPPFNVIIDPAFRALGRQDLAELLSYVPVAGPLVKEHVKKK